MRFEKNLRYQRFSKHPPCLTFALRYRPKSDLGFTRNAVDWSRNVDEQQTSSFDPKYAGSVRIRTLFIADRSLRR